MELSIIIPYHNEGAEFISATLLSIRETIDIEDYEIIIVDDCSVEPLGNIDGVCVLSHNDNLGVGASFDTGVKFALSDNLFLMGSDIRFIKNKWASRMITEIQNHPQSFTCTSCVNINKDNMDIEDRKSVGVPSGATILMFHDRKSNPRVSETFRGIIEAKWLPNLPDRNIDSFEIPCILGAAYGVTKRWYNYVDGWAGHWKWGTLEPYISLKSWFFGGSCRVAPGIETAHIFKKEGTHGTPQDALIYNKMFVSMVLFEDYQRLIDFLGTNPIVDRARLLIENDKPYILSKQTEYSKKIVVNPQDFFKRWKIDYRVQNPIEIEADGIYFRSEHYNALFEKSPYYRVWKEVLKNINGSVVDIGCGPGQFMDMCLSNGIEKYTGYDVSGVAINKAKEIRELKYPDKNIRLFKQDLLIETNIEKADIYVLCEILEHIIDDHLILSLIPTGKTVIITLPNYMGGSHVRKFDTPEDIKTRFTEIDFESFEVLSMGKDRIIIISVGKKI